MSWLWRNLLIRGYEDVLHRRTVFSEWADLERSQWLSTAELKALQAAKLKRLLAHAARHSSYYREDWRRRSLDPARIGAVEDLQAWPVIDRDTVRENREAMRSLSPGIELFPKATGGSSGVPLQFDQDTACYTMRMAAGHRGYSWAGAAPGTRQLHLWGTALGPKPLSTRLKTALHDRLYRREILSCFDLSEATAGRFLERVNRHRPDVIVAYTNALYAFARLLQERGDVPFSPRALVAGAEKLHRFQRELIEQVFRAPVFETYGAREFTLIAAECERRAGLHVTMEHLVVEVLDDQGRPVPPGGEGDVVVTDLVNYGLPFVRYRNGDRAIVADRACPCGRGLVTLREVVGRRLDVLETSDGRHVPGEFFPHLLKDFPAVRRFQVVQDSLSDVRLRIVLRDDSAAACDAIEREVRRVLGPAVRFRVEPVADIPLNSSGKLQVVLSRVRPRPGAPGT